MARPVNAAALAIAKISESCVLYGYRDPGGVATAGYGHTGANVHVGETYSQKQADAWFAADMAEAAAFVEAHVTVDLTDNQFSALAEFVFNIGVGNFLGSTLLKKLNAGNYPAVPAELMRWNKVAGKLLPGLVARRAKEAGLFTTPDAHVPQNASMTTASAPVESEQAHPSAPSLIESIRAWWHTEFGAAKAA